MKKGMICLLLVCMVISLSLYSCGEKEPTVTYSQGLSYVSLPDGTCGVDGIGTCTDTEIQIPDKAPNGKKVTAIAGYAFQDRTDIVSVKIPSSVTSIGAYAFAGCTGISGMTLPDGVKEIGLYAFSRCEKLKQIYLGSSLEKVADGAFYSCTSLQYAFYRGGDAAWAKVNVGAGNSALTLSGVLHLYSAKAPTTSGSYWYYANGSIGIWS